jgi:hypothetical protein
VLLLALTHGCVSRSETPLLQPFSPLRTRPLALAAPAADPDAVAAALAKAREAGRNVKPSDIKKDVIKRTGTEPLEEAWHSLDTKDFWQDFNQGHKDFLAAELNFWSLCGGVSLSTSRPADPARSTPAPSPRPRRSRSRGPA